jgi:uncharacterized membrane protein
MSRFLCGVFAVGGALHVLFMLLELFPWSHPFLLRKLIGELPDHQHFTAHQHHLQILVVTIVHNAGIYNGIVAGGFICAALGYCSPDVGRVMLLGAVVAGVFGTLTLKSRGTALQAAYGLAGLILPLFIRG